MSTEVIAERSAEYYPESVTFFEQHKDSLRRLFSALGREALWSEDVHEILPYTHQRWLGTEHGLTPEKDTYTLGQMETAWPILGEMGLLDEILPSEGVEVDQVVVVGGLMRANHERLLYVKRLLDEGHITTDGQIIFWAGQRHRYDAEAATADEMFDPDGRYPGNDDSANLWVEHQRSLSWDEGDRWSRGIATETETARLAVTRIFDPSLQAHRIGLASTPTVKHIEVPPRLVLDYHYQPDGYPEIIIANASATERVQGPARHTTASCAKESFDRYPPDINAKVLFVSGNPHTKRTAEDVQDVLRQSGRADVELLPVGPAIKSGATIQLVLGEVASLLYWSAHRDKIRA